MTTYEHTFDDNKSISLFPLLLVGIILVGLAFVAVGKIGYKYSHALDKHGMDAITVRQCMTGNDNFWIMPNTTYKARFCQISENEFGIQIVKKVNGKWEEITAFIRKQGANSMSIEEYLVEHGYVNPSW